MNELYIARKISELPMPSVKDRQKINVRYKGRPELLQFVNGKWCWYDGDSVEGSDKYPVDEDSWPAIDWLEKTTLENLIAENPQAVENIFKAARIKSRKFDANGMVYWGDTFETAQDYINSLKDK